MKLFYLILLTVEQSKCTPYLRVSSFTSHLSPFLKAPDSVRVCAVSSTVFTCPWYVPKASPQSTEMTLPTQLALISVKNK